MANEPLAFHSTAKAALLGRIGELRAIVQQYDKLTVRALRLLQFAGVLTFVLGFGASLIALRSDTPTTPAGFPAIPQDKWRLGQVILPFLCPFAAVWAVKRYKRLALRTYVRTAYTELLRKAELQLPLATNDEICTQIHDHLNKEMSRIDDEQEAMHRAILYPGDLPPGEKKSKKLRIR